MPLVDEILSAMAGAMPTCGALLFLNEGNDRDSKGQKFMKCEFTESSKKIGKDVLNSFCTSRNFDHEIGIHLTQMGYKVTDDDIDKVKPFVCFR
jgi:hypothetical protein